MAFTNNITSNIGKVRLRAGEYNEDTYVFEDDVITECLSDSGNVVVLAAYKIVRAKQAYLASLPASQSWSTYSQSMDMNALDRMAEALKKELEDTGYALDGEDVAQWGHAEIASTRGTWRRVEANKVARGEPW